jgi:hypothetical protein
MKFIMSNRNAALANTGRHARFAPGWWFLPGMVASAAVWPAIIWLIAR